MADIVITEFMDEEAVRGLAKDFEVLYEPDLPDRLPDLLQLVADCRGLIVRNRTQVRAALLDAAARLRVVGRLGVGLDNIDLDACAARSIPVIPATGANEPTVAEYVIAAIILLLRGSTFHCTPEVLAGGWPRMACRGRDAMGRRLGLVGFGRIAREVAGRASALNMRVAAYDPYVSAGDEAWSRGVERAELGRLLADSDVVSVHVPLTPETRHLLGADALARMKPGALLVNAARGGIVDEHALADALRSGRLGGAVLDVFESEPLPAGSHLVGVPNLVLTPHVAGYTEEANRRQGEIIATGVRRILAG
jgi:(S)-sulfolactate dehydrogenase